MLSDNNTQGRFSTDGITQSSTTNSTFVQCTSTHLTSFAVLVDVSGESVSPVTLAWYKISCFNCTKYLLYKNNYVNLFALGMSEYYVYYRMHISLQISWFCGIPLPTRINPFSYQFL